MMHTRTGIARPRDSPGSALSWTKHVGANESCCRKRAGERGGKVLFFSLWKLSGLLGARGYVSVLKEIAL